MSLTESAMEPALSPAPSQLLASIPTQRVPHSRPRPTTSTRRAADLGWKRAIDIALGSVLMIVALPTMLVIAVLVFVADPGPVYFRQTRIGRGGRPFKIWKFRTMIRGAEAALLADPGLYSQYVDFQHKLPTSTDLRVLPIGRLLRRTSLDELPQLFNVLAGSMSLVGPRPVTAPELEYYGADAEAVLSVRPGMTGLWQVSGRNAVAFPERAQLDLHYATTASLDMDTRILLKTVGAVLRCKGTE